VTLRRLLDFYKGLKEAMPHFNSNIHTTTDIVREVIIPASACGRCAYATQLMGGKLARPCRMVTHNWSNLFRDLVASVAASALQQSSYTLVAVLLDQDVAALEHMLDPSDLETSYWVCAFAVNQHCSICAENAQHTRDPVTGKTHPLCDCGCPKHLNHSPPLRSDGKSVLCEMNKFDDVMAYLSATDRDFAQVIAVDRKFDLFSRAWCVAEIAMAHRMGMPQHVCLVSQKALARARSRLEDLDVSHMEAARPEDVQEILSRIEDVAAFNRRLREMLLGRHGLLRRWGSFDMVGQASEVARVALLVAAYTRLCQRRTYFCMSEDMEDIGSGFEDAESATETDSIASSRTSN